MDIPQWHESGFDPQDVVSLIDIRGLIENSHHPFSYDSLRSYATGRRTHKALGKMPRAVARISNRRLWLRMEILQWLDPITNDDHLLRARAFSSLNKPG